MADQSIIVKKQGTIFLAGPPLVRRNPVNCCLLLVDTCVCNVFPSNIMFSLGQQALRYSSDSYEAFVISGF